jgi:hypothetical protein
MFYPEVYKHLNKDPFKKKQYGERIFSCMEDLRKKISLDPEMHAWMRCKENRYEDLYEAMIERIEDLIPIGNDVNDPEFEMYNVMHERSFYNIWTNDLLRHMLNYKR